MDAALSRHGLSVSEPQRAALHAAHVHLQRLQQRVRVLASRTELSEIGP